MKSAHPETVAVAYVPVLHAGYRAFFDTALHDGAEAIYLIGDDILAAHEELDYINRKDRLRAIPVERMQKALGVLTEVPVHILTRENVATLESAVIVAPQEDITDLLVREYFTDAEVKQVPIFLRWHRDNTAEEKAVEAHRGDITDLDRAFMVQACTEGEKSFDWWRQVGAVIAKDSEVLLVGRNTHVPHEQSPNINGDPRSVSKRGVDIHLTTALHGEGALIAEAARKGMSLDGATLYVTDFPCPYCARLIAHSGIKKCFFARGYAALDGEAVLKDAGVELIHVDIQKGRG